MIKIPLKIISKNKNIDAIKYIILWVYFIRSMTLIKITLYIILHTEEEMMPWKLQNPLLQTSFKDIIIYEDIIDVIYKTSLIKKNWCHH